MFLANFPAPDPASFWQVLLSLAALVLFIERGAALVSRFSSKPSRREVSFAAEFATRDELERVRTDVEILDKKLTTLEEAVRSGDVRIIDAGEVRATKIHERINLIDREIGTLRGTVDGHTQLLARIDNKLDRALARS